VASGLIYNEDGDDITMDALAEAVETMEDPQPCAFVVFVGSPNPESSRFGPDEMCEYDAEPGQDYCSGHLPWTEN
jgi:hypothetical protein